MRISAYGDVLRRNAITHDQEMFASPEVMVLRKQTYVSSRRALILELVRTGQLGWTDDVVTTIYAGLNSDVMHAFSVYSGADGDMPRESDIMRGARADIVDAGYAPAFAVEVRNRFRETGSPLEISVPRAITGGGDTVHFIDPATSLYTPESVEAERRIMAATKHELVEIIGFTAGYELMELGFQDEARSAMQQVLQGVAEHGATRIVTSSPEAMVAMSRFAPTLGLDHALEVLHLAEWIGRSGLSFDSPRQMLPTVLHDSFNLARYLERNATVEKIMHDLVGGSLRAMAYQGFRSVPSGPVAPYIFEDAIAEMADRIMIDASAAGAWRVVTCSPWDFRNLMLTSADHDLEIVDFSDLVLRCLED